jgi:hypothetical protein
MLFLWPKAVPPETLYQLIVFAEATFLKLQFQMQTEPGVVAVIGDGFMVAITSIF